MTEISKMFENVGIKKKIKIAIFFDKFIMASLVIISLPFILLFEGSNRVFQFLADFNQNCSEFITDIGSIIYHKLTDLIIKWINSPTKIKSE